MNSKPYKKYLLCIHPTIREGVCSIKPQFYAGNTCLNSIKKVFGDG